MNTSKNQLERLLRGAAASRRSAVPERVNLPTAAWLIARTQPRDQIAPGVFMILRRGLAAACILLLATGFVAAREIRQQQATVINLPIPAPFEVAGVFVP